MATGAAWVPAFESLPSVASQTRQPLESTVPPPAAVAPPVDVDVPPVEVMAPPVELDVPPVEVVAPPAALPPVAFEPPAVAAPPVDLPPVGAAPPAVAAPPVAVVVAPPVALPPWLVAPPVAVEVPPLEGNVPPVELLTPPVDGVLVAPPVLAAMPPVLLAVVPPFGEVPPLPATTGSVLPLPQPMTRTKQDENIAQIDRFNMVASDGRILRSVFRQQQGRSDVDSRLTLRVRMTVAQNSINDCRYMRQRYGELRAYRRRADRDTIE